MGTTVCGSRATGAELQPIKIRKTLRAPSSRQSRLSQPRSRPIKIEDAVFSPLKHLAREKLNRRSYFFSVTYSLAAGLSTRPRDVLGDFFMLGQMQSLASKLARLLDGVGECATATIIPKCSLAGFPIAAIPKLYVNAMNP